MKNFSTDFKRKLRIMYLFVTIYIDKFCHKDTNIFNDYIYKTYNSNYILISRECMDYFLNLFECPKNYQYLGCFLNDTRKGFEFKFRKEVTDGTSFNRTMTFSLDIKDFIKYFLDDIKNGKKITSYELTRYLLIND